MLSLDPLHLCKCLADETRLMSMLLVLHEQELCVCEMTHALQESQPKVSRHLAELRRYGLLSARRESQWIYYGLASTLPGWVMSILEAAAEGRSEDLQRLRKRLDSMGNRPERRAALC
ncbi:metalloregulator ArsR/SmtB family transcription factor [Halomonas huangheensis]|nr:metalloregulator ArsR/SmtB family transcription factor [Halomonas huangheensis]ALM54645.1 ArsR family transcriptional regulator [Halomonas huangheensis]